MLGQADIHIQSAFAGLQADHVAQPRLGVNVAVNFAQRRAESEGQRVALVISTRST